MTMPDTELPEIRMPAPPASVPEMTLRSLEEAPPIVSSMAPFVMPMPLELSMADVPAMFVPM